MSFIYKQSLCNIWDTTIREIVMNVKGLKISRVLCIVFLLGTFILSYLTEGETPDTMIYVTSRYVNCPIRVPSSLAHFKCFTVIWFNHLSMANSQYFQLCLTCNHTLCLSQYARLWDSFLFQSDVDFRTLFCHRFLKNY